MNIDVNFLVEVLKCFGIVLLMCAGFAVAATILIMWPFGVLGILLATWFTYLVYDARN